MADKQKMRWSWISSKFYSLKTFNVRSIASLKAVVTVALVVFTFYFYVGHIQDQFTDFRAFYCSGKLELAGIDPYRDHPLHECEQSLAAPWIKPLRIAATIPAPFPGYVLALFAAMATLKFPLALAIWTITGWAALGLSVLLVARTTRVSLLASAIVLGFPAAVVALPLGQLTPIMLSALAGSALLLQQARPRWAAAVSFASLLDPHVGLALWLGLFVGLREARPVLLAGAASLVGLGLVVSGPLREWEYLHAVIPAHALANLSDSMQFSAANFAFALGAQPANALMIGTLWYVASLVLGVFVALRLRRRLGVASLAYVPIAFAVFGGTHTHVQQLSLALPTFLLLRSQATPRSRDFYGGLAYIATVPWIIIAPFPLLYLVAPLLAMLLARDIMRTKLAFEMSLGSLALMTVVLQVSLAWHIFRSPARLEIYGNPLAEVSWQALTLARSVPTEPWTIVAKAPTILAFLILLGVLTIMAIGHASMGMASPESRSACDGARHLARFRHAGPHVTSRLR